MPKYRTPAAALAFAFMVLAWSGAPSAHDRRAAEAASEPGTLGETGLAQQLPGFRQPRPDLITGGQPRPEMWPALADRGVTTVINLRTPAEMEGRDQAGEVNAAGMRYHALPVSGAGDLDGRRAAELWRLIEAAPGTVVVHCATANRAGALLALAAAEHGGLQPQEALEFGRSAGLGSLEPEVRRRLGLAPEAD